jgi:large repetitive protein
VRVAARVHARDGTHTFRVRAIDAAGNLDATHASDTWTVDATAPETTIASGPAATTTETTATFAFTASETATFACGLDGGALAPCSSPMTYTALAVGAHRFTVRATDAVGNIDATPATYDWTITAPVPETTIASGPASSTADTTATFAFTGSDAAGRFECSVDGGAFAACTSPATFTGLAAGGHQFEVRSIDAAGNVDPTPAVWTWTIVVETDTTSPATTTTTATTGVDQTPATQTPSANG